MDYGSHYFLPCSYMAIKNKEILWQIVFQLLRLYWQLYSLDSSICRITRVIILNIKFYITLPSRPSVKLSTIMQARNTKKLMLYNPIFSTFGKFSSLYQNFSWYFCLLCKIWEKVETRNNLLQLLTHDAGLSIICSLQCSVENTKKLVVRVD